MHSRCSKSHRHFGRALAAAESCARKRPRRARARRRAARHDKAARDRAHHSVSIVHTTLPVDASRMFIATLRVAGGSAGHASRSSRARGRARGRGGAPAAAGRAAGSCGWSRGPRDAWPAGQGAERSRERDNGQGERGGVHFEALVDGAGAFIRAHHNLADLRPMRRRRHGAARRRVACAGPCARARVRCALRWPLARCGWRLVRACERLPFLGTCDFESDGQVCCHFSGTRVSQLRDNSGVFETSHERKGLASPPPQGSPLRPARPPRAAQ